MIRHINLSNNIMLSLCGDKSIANTTMSNISCESRWRFAKQILPLPHGKMKTRV